MDEATPGTLSIYKTRPELLPAEVLAELVDLARAMDHATFEPMALGFYRGEWMHDYPYSPEHPLTATLDAARRGLLAVTFAHEPGIETGGTYLVHAENLNLELAYTLSGPAVPLPAHLSGNALRTHLLKHAERYEAFLRIRANAVPFDEAELALLKELHEGPQRPARGQPHALVYRHGRQLFWRAGTGPTVAISAPPDTAGAFNFVLYANDEPASNAPFRDPVEAHAYAQDLLTAKNPPQRITLELRAAGELPVVFTLYQEPGS